MVRRLALLWCVVLSAVAAAHAIKVGDSLVITSSSVWLHSSPGVRDSELLQSDLRSNRDRIIVTAIREVSGETWYKVRIGCDCPVAPSKPSLGKFPDSYGWLVDRDVKVAPKSVSATPPPKPASNPRWVLRDQYMREARNLLQQCAGQPDHIARIRELQSKVNATVVAGGKDWLEAAGFLMDAMRMRATRCR